MLMCGSAMCAVKAAQRGLIAAGMSMAVSAMVMAEPMSYVIQPRHTFVSFETSHQGLSFWRGKFNNTSAGKIVLDREAGTGSVEITVDTSSVSFGLPVMDQVARTDFFKVDEFPTATYKAGSITFKDGVPAIVDGELTLLGVTKRVPLEIRYFKCMISPLFKREICGADAHGEFNRADFGMTREAKPDPMVRLAIQVEAYRGDALPQLSPSEAEALKKKVEKEQGE